MPLEDLLNDYADTLEGLDGLCVQTWRFDMAESYRQPPLNRPLPSNLGPEIEPNAAPDTSSSQAQLVKYYCNFPACNHYCNHQAYSTVHTLLSSRSGPALACFSWLWRRSLLAQSTADEHPILRTGGYP